MTLRDLNLATAYETTNDSTGLVDEFYIPVLEQSNKYYRIAGFFSSSSLVVAAKGIQGLINNDGKMYLLVSPELSEEDYRIISTHNKLTENMDLFSDLKFDTIPDEHLQALAWMLDSGRLEIKIVVSTNYKTGLFHQKVGIVFDEQKNIVSFSGSINETAQAWLKNIEEFKVFKSWEDGQQEYLNADLKKFLSYWKNERQDIAKVYDIPGAIRDKIVSIKPRDIYDLNIMRKYRKHTRVNDSGIPLFPHQEKAVQKWKDNQYSLLMEMATGTGKTRTAIACANELIKKGEKLLIVVATPQVTLSQQWEKEFDDLNVVIEKKELIPGAYTKTKWKKQLRLLLLDLADDLIRTGLVLTTHETASSQDFRDIILTEKYDTKILFIGDEVHALGSKEQRKALVDSYDYRIGLSATPDRMFDESGTSVIKEYFGAASFEFSIADAINTVNPLTGKSFLNHFNYYPVFVELTDAEMKEYNAYSKKIAVLLNQDDCDDDELQKLYNLRANIAKNASNKFAVFDEILTEMQPEKIQDTILFVSDQQIETCFKILEDKNIIRAKITEKESAKKKVNADGETERQDIIQKFRDRDIQMLVGIKCLDEGIDISTARIAILMSNSTNPREYVQRIGRVIRTGKDKEKSEIYDFVVYGSDSGILKKEARRTYQIAINADNFDQVEQLFNERGVYFDADQ